MALINGERFEWSPANDFGDCMALVARSVRSAPVYLKWVEGPAPVTVRDLWNPSNKYRYVNLLEMVDGADEPAFPLERLYPDGEEPPETPGVPLLERIFVATHALRDQPEFELLMKTAGNLSDFDRTLRQAPDTRRELRAQLAEVARRAERAAETAARLEAMPLLREMTPLQMTRDVYVMDLGLHDVTPLELLDRLTVRDGRLPYAASGGFYKRLKGFRPPSRWKGQDPEEGVLLKVSTAAGAYSDAALAVDPKTRRVSLICDRPAGVSRQEYTQRALAPLPNQLTRRVGSADLALQVGYAARCAAPARRVDPPLFQDLLMTHPVLRRCLATDESVKPTRTRTHLYMHLGHTGVTVSLQERYQERPDQFEPLTAGGQGLPYLQLRIKAYDRQSGFTARRVVAAALRAYHQSVSELEAVYRQWTQLERQPSPEAARKSRRKPRKPAEAADGRRRALRDVAPRIFVPTYSRKCLHMPTLPASPQEEAELTARGLPSMVFPIYGEDEPRRYFCLHPQHPYPGLRANTLSNRRRFPFVPCCYSRDQKLKKGSKWHSYFDRVPDYASSQATASTATFAPPFAALDDEPEPPVEFDPRRLPAKLTAFFRQVLRRDDLDPSRTPGPEQAGRLTRRAAAAWGLPVSGETWDPLLDSATAAVMLAVEGAEPDAEAVRAAQARMDADPRFAGVCAQEVHGADRGYGKLAARGVDWSRPLLCHRALEERWAVNLFFFDGAGPLVPPARWCRLPSFDPQRPSLVLFVESQATDSAALQQQRREGDGGREEEEEEDEDAERDEDEEYEERGSQTCCPVRLFAALDSDSAGSSSAEPGALVPAGHPVAAELAWVLREADAAYVDGLPYKPPAPPPPGLPAVAQGLDGMGKRRRLLLAARDGSEALTLETDPAPPLLLPVKTEGWPLPETKARALSLLRGMGVRFVEAAPPRGGAGGEAKEEKGASPPGGALEGTADGMPCRVPLRAPEKRRDPFSQVFAQAEKTARLLTEYARWSFAGWLRAAGPGGETGQGAVTRYAGEAVVVDPLVSYAGDLPGPRFQKPNIFVDAAGRLRVPDQETRRRLLYGLYVALQDAQEADRFAETYGEGRTGVLVPGYYATAGDFRPGRHYVVGSWRQERQGGGRADEESCHQPSVARTQPDADCDIYYLQVPGSNRVYLVQTCESAEAAAATAAVWDSEGWNRGGREPVADESGCLPPAALPGGARPPLRAWLGPDEGLGVVEVAGDGGVAAGEGQGPPQDRTLSFTMVHLQGEDRHPTFSAVLSLQAPAALRLAKLR